MSFPIISYKILKKFLNGWDTQLIMRDMLIPRTLIEDTIRWGFTKEGHKLIKYIEKEVIKNGKLSTPNRCSRSHTKQA
jgi:hypothetical protein